MKQFLEFVAESKTKTIYHGDNHNTRKLDPKLMKNGNNQEGVGIYFSDDIDVAKFYGKDVISIDINEKDFVNSRGPISVVGRNKIINMMLDLRKIDDEEFYYYITDWGVELSEPEDVTDDMIADLYPYMKDEEVRNWQIDMGEKFGVEDFVRIWNKHCKIKGTYFYQGDNNWYAVIDPSFKIKKV